ncbi:MAG: radical SAM/SPASM domain-containing protein [Gammaproteobacteria bacterium]
MNGKAASHADEVETPQYGFYARLSAEFPSQVVIDCTEVCNLACIHCPHPEFKQSLHYQARYLDPAVNRQVIDEIREYGRGKTQYIRYTSEGEPLIHPQAYDMIEYAVQNSGVFVTLTTNGTIMNEKRTRRLLEAGVHMIDISIDAVMPETYARVRVNGDLNVTRANVERLIAWNREAGSPARIVVSFVEQPENSAEAPEFERLWRERGADEVVVRRIHSSAGAISGLAAILRRQDAGEPRRPCLYPWERVIVTPRGCLAFCPQDWVHGSEFADLRETTIREAWQGEFYRALRAAHLQDDYRAHAFCGQCPDWKQTRWPGAGRSYADLVADLRGDGNA